MTDRPYQPRRSFIFMPGNRPEMFPKALASGADIVCIDLEDAIAPQHKAEARDKTMRLFAQPQADDGVERLVRINGLRTREGLADLLAILDAERAPPGLMLPKIKHPAEIRALDELLSEHGKACRLNVIVETNEGLEAAFEIGRASDRIDALFFGGVDMAADLRAAGTWESLLMARARVVHAAAAAGLDAIDVPYLDLDDLDGMRREAEAAAALGFTGKGSIHPKQIAALNAVFSPTAEQVDRAKRIVAAFETGDSGLVVIDNKLIEKPVLRTMYRVLAAAERMAARG